MSKNEIIYNFANQSACDLNQVLIGIILLVIGVVMFFVFSKYRPEIKENIYTRVFGHTREDLIKKSQMTPKIFKMVGVIIFIGAVLILFPQVKNYFYTNHTPFFVDTESINCKIDSVKTNKILNSDYISIYTDNKKFTILKDSRYVAFRNLLKNDSIAIEYFEENVKNEPSDLKWKKRSK
ncbi:hypothetical protein [uncultured Draconibacterium sp.]|uniref:hypothetical protein n=1 Tax=uncultured Draconibacterium sp. TaxID=1573823 RepID=UPI0032176722